MVSSRPAAKLLLFASSLTPLALRSQTSADALKVRLLHKQYFLSSLCSEAQVRFDERGELAKNCDVAPFTVSLFRIISVKESPAGLDLRMHRLELTFKQNAPHTVDLAGRVRGGLSNEVSVYVARPASGDYGPALDRIFTTQVSDLYEKVPVYWHDFFRAHLMPAGWKPEKLDPVLPGPVPLVPGPKTGTTFPEVTQQVDASYTVYGAAAEFSGSVLVGLVVDTEGMPTRLHIISPAGLAMDEEALAAVSEYRFAPATKDGVPVPAMLNVDVRFEAR